MTVTPEDRQAMANIMNMLNGKNTTPLAARPMTESHSVELAGPGQVTQTDINAMAGVLAKLNQVSNEVVDDLLTEGYTDTRVANALYTEREPDGVKVGRYKIEVRQDDTRLAGKQYYAIYNTLTKDVIADDLSLYETALTVVRLLNGGKVANSPEVMKLFEQDDLYTSHKVDALLYKTRLKKTNNTSKRSIYESRYQASLDRCMAAKKLIKGFGGEY
jgi:hypothetical protein